MNNRKNQSAFVRAIKKFFLSAFVVFSFIAYALEKPASSSQAQLGGTPSTGQGGNSSPQVTSPKGSTDPGSAAQVAAPTATPAATASAAAPAATDTSPAATATSPAAAASSQYKDGTYTGQQEDAQWGIVQVQVTIQGGKIANVQFLQYPSDRRTSQRINSFAVPALQQEAVQAQSANVDLIGGATLTSEAFQMSLQTALNAAKGSL